MDDRENPYEVSSIVDDTVDAPSIYFDRNVSFSGEVSLRDCAHAFRHPRSLALSTVLTVMICFALFVLTPRLARGGSAQLSLILIFALSLVSLGRFMWKSSGQGLAREIVRMNPSVLGTISGNFFEDRMVIHRPGNTTITISLSAITAVFYAPSTIRITTDSMKARSIVLPWRLFNAGEDAYVRMQLDSMARISTNLPDKQEDRRVIDREFQLEQLNMADPEAIKFEGEILLQDLLGSPHLNKLKRFAFARLPRRLFVFALYGVGVYGLYADQPRLQQVFLTFLLLVAGWTVLRIVLSIRRIVQSPTKPVIKCRGFISPGRLCLENPLARIEVSAREFESISIAPESVVFTFPGTYPSSQSIARRCFENDEQWNSAVDMVVAAARPESIHRRSR